ncbi:MAG: peptidylprolyl isomerase, partial [Paraperlucidibaca sp.]
MPRLLLITGLLGGMLAAGYSIVQQVPAADLPAHVIARVGERLILRDEWLKAVAATTSERRTPLTTAQQRQILDRLIDEELLVQHGLSLGLVQRDQRLRGQLISEVLFTTTAAVADSGQDDDTLVKFYADHLGLFVPPAQLRVKAWRLQADGSRADFLPPVPDSLLPLGKLQAYLGPDLVAAAMTLPIGEDSRPISSNGEHVVLRVEQQQLASPPAFAQMREQVRREVRRRADEAAVQSLLHDLRRSYGVQQAVLP